VSTFLRRPLSQNYRFLLTRYTTDEIYARHTSRSGLYNGRSCLEELGRIAFPTLSQGNKCAPVRRSFTRLSIAPEHLPH
jgi:hypothetical protein